MVMKATCFEIPTIIMSGFSMSNRYESYKADKECIYQLVIAV